MSKVIEVRRHTYRVKPGQHLSQEGVTLARRVGAELGTFQRVVTSTVPRAFETAIAMGFAVDEQSDLIATYGGEIEKEIPWPQPFSVYAEAVKRGGAAADYASQLADFYQALVKSLPEAGAALVISHGGVVELSAVACLTEADFGSFGAHCECCEGFRMIWDHGKFVSAEVIRV